MPGLDPNLRSAGKFFVSFLFLCQTACTSVYIITVKRRYDYIRGEIQLTLPPVSVYDFRSEFLQILKVATYVVLSDDRHQLCTEHNILMYYKSFQTLVIL